MLENCSQYDLLEAGCDEAGRGCLAGAVFAAAVILPPDFHDPLLNDSKQMSERNRDRLRTVIEREAIAWAVEAVPPARIDEINILQATYEAMREAISKLSVVPDLLLNDAVTIPQISIRQVPIIKGDARSVSIAAASILAKVTRDRLMAEYDSMYPQYEFAVHKGYGTAAHIEALKTYGPCPVHRNTFIKGIV